MWHCLHTTRKLANHRAKQTLPSDLQPLQDAVETVCQGVTYSWRRGKDISKSSCRPLEFSRVQHHPSIIHGGLPELLDVVEWSLGTVPGICSLPEEWMALKTQVNASLFLKFLVDHSNRRWPLSSVFAWGYFGARSCHFYQYNWQACVTHSLICEELFWVDGLWFGWRQFGSLGLAILNFWSQN